MAVIKVFDSLGCKTVKLQGDLVNDQEYDLIPDEEIDGADQDPEAPE